MWREIESPSQHVTASLSTLPLFPSFFLFFLAPLTWFLLGSKKKRLATFQRVEAVKGENECLFCRLMIDTVFNRKLEGIIRSGRTGGVEARLTDLERCVILWNYCERDEAIDLSWHWDSFCIYFSTWSDMRFNRDTFFHLTKLWVNEWEIAFFLLNSPKNPSSKLLRIRISRIDRFPFEQLFN